MSQTLIFRFSWEIFAERGAHMSKVSVIPENSNIDQKDTWTIEQHQIMNYKLQAINHKSWRGLLITWQHQNPGALWAAAAADSCVTWRQSTSSNRSKPRRCAGQNIHNYILDIWVKLFQNPEVFFSDFLSSLPLLFFWLEKLFVRQSQPLFKPKIMKIFKSCHSLAAILVEDQICVTCSCWQLHDLMYFSPFHRSMAKL